MLSSTFCIFFSYLFFVEFLYIKRKVICDSMHQDCTLRETADNTRIFPLYAEKIRVLSADFPQCTVLVHNNTEFLDLMWKNRYVELADFTLTKDFSSQHHI